MNLTKKIDNFTIFQSREINLSIFIAKFIRSIWTRNCIINVSSVNFALFVQFTVLLPKCYPIRQQFGSRDPPGKGEDLFPYVEKEFKFRILWRGKFLPVS